MTAAMGVVSVNVALGRSVSWQGGTVRTGIFKEPVLGRVRVGPLGLEGDEQADLEVHGGPLKAVYAYPSEHYAFWRSALPETALPWGAFGENLTIVGSLESSVHVGDRFRIGTAILAATKPRFPCFKLGIRLGRDDLVDRFLASGRTGFYLRVVQGGDVGAGDSIEPLERMTAAPTIADLAAERRREAGSAP
ncbi:MAG TPA: MOSC domain-containing protein [Thermoplasmata archaeon]|nr:MOSC domain-containing protein [Thermoplasmata archaeon]